MCDSSFSTVNLLTNGDFELTYANTSSQGTRLFPTDWTAESYTTSNNGNDLSGVSPSVENTTVSPGSDFPGILRGQCLQITTQPNQGRSMFLQEKPISGSGGDVFLAGCWAKANSVPIEGESVKKYFGLRVRFKSGSTWLTEEGMLKLNSAQTGWQFGCLAVKAPAAYTAVDVACTYSRNANRA